MLEPTSEEIKNGNELIVKFLLRNNKEIIPNFKNHPANRYDKSYDDLMPILKTINDFGCIVEISYSLVFYCRICVIGEKNEKAFNIMHDNNGGLDSIIPIWRCVVEYIEWYDRKNEDSRLLINVLE